MSLLYLLLTIILTFISADAAAVVVNNPITLDISRVANSLGMRNLIAHDRARVKAIRERARLNVRETRELTYDQPIHDGTVGYFATVGIGNPPTTYKLLVDTGSSNTWIGAGIQYVPTSTSINTGNNVSVTYAMGNFSGVQYTDQVTLTLNESSVIISNQSIGVASSVSGFTGFDGILGLGPVELTNGTLFPNTTSTIPTVTDNLYANGTIHNNEIGVYFRPSIGNSSMEMNGELTWGGVDSAKIIKPVVYIPRTTTYPSSEFWGIDQSIQYGSSTILSTTAGIVDTGVTFIWMATDAFTQYASATGAIFDSKVGLLAITPENYAKLKSLYFTTRGTTFELIPNAQIWPRSLNNVIGGNSSSIYLIVTDLGRPSGQGLDFINGFCFLQRYYSAYDNTDKQVGFAVTRDTTAETN